LSRTFRLVKTLETSSNGLVVVGAALDVEVLAFYIFLIRYLIAKVQRLKKHYRLIKY